MSCKMCNTFDINTRKPIEADGCDLDCIPFMKNGTLEGVRLQDIKCEECVQLFQNFDTYGLDRGDLVARCLSKCIIPGSGADGGGEGSGGVYEQEEQVSQTNKKIIAAALLIILGIVLLALLYIK